MQNQIKSFTFKFQRCSQRIDNFLFKKLKGVPKKKIYHIIRNGEVRVNSSRVKPNYKIKFNDLVRIPPIFIKEKPFLFDVFKMEKFVEKIKKCILYEDKYLLVINKPSGIAVHGGSGLKFGIIEALRLTCFKNRFLELIHRLDLSTSGVLLMAKKNFALKKMHEQIRLKQVQKKYIALVKGRWPLNFQRVCVPLTKSNSRNKKKIIIVDKKGKISETRFKIKKQFFHFTLLEVYPITGRSHQIRVHTQYVSHPIIGDDRYGDFKLNKKISEIGLNRMFLHASFIKFIHPITKKELVLKSSLGKDLKKCLKKIKNYNLNDVF